MHMVLAQGNSVKAANVVAKVKTIVNGLPASEDFGGRILREVLLEAEEMYIFNVELTTQLLEARVFAASEWDARISKYIKECSGQAKEKALQFLAEVVRRLVFEGKVITQEQIPCIMELLTALDASKDSHSEMLKFYVGDVFEQLQSQIPSEYDLKLRAYFRKWVELSQIESAADQEVEMNKFFAEMSSLGIEKDEEVLFAFCKIMVRESIELSMHSRLGDRRPNNFSLDYRFIDSFIKLVLCLLTSSDLNQLQFMSKIFEFIRQKLDDDHFQQMRAFNQKPFFRMLINILRAVTMSDCFNAKTQRYILFDLANLLQDLNPNNYPAFAFAWLALISNQFFMPHFIRMPPGHANFNQTVVQQAIDSQNFERVPEPAAAGGKGHKRGQSSGSAGTQQQANLNEINIQLQKLHKMKDLLCQCFVFIKHNFVLGQEATSAQRSFYTATVNVLLAILKDYPQFLCDFHFNFVNSLPDHAVQLKNMVLAAFPKSVNPPAPFSQGLKVNPMQDVKQPRILSNFKAYLKMNGLKKSLDDFFETKNLMLVNDICVKMMSSKERINGKVVPMCSVINAVVLYIASHVQDEKGKSAEAFQEKESIELFRQITVQLNDETRLCFFNSIANELRYPNSHTYFFCLILLHLFAESKANIQEQISAVLFERLQSLRPHPWGLMINFRELLQNQKYGFMRSSLVSQNQEAIKNLFAYKERLRNFLHFLPQKQPQMMAAMPQGQPGFPGGVIPGQFGQFGQQPPVGL